MLNEAGRNTCAAGSLHCNEAGKTWHSGRISHYRWNVLDLMSLFGRGSLTCHLFCDIDMARVEELRKQFKTEGHNVTVTAFLIKAISLAQYRHPASRTMCLPGSRLVTYNDIVAGFTVEKEVEGQAIVFFGEIEGSDKKPLGQLAKELKDYAESDVAQVPKLREQRLFSQLPWLVRQLILHLADWFPSVRFRLIGATFGLNSLGALGVMALAGPSACTSVFGVGAVTQLAVVCDGEIVLRPQLTLSLNFDQRVMSVGQASQFLKDIKALLEGDLADLVASDNA